MLGTLLDFPLTDSCSQLVTTVVRVVLGIKTMTVGGSARL